MTNNFTPAKAGQQRNRLSKEEYAEKMKAEKEAVYQMADDILIPANWAGIRRCLQQ